MLKSEHSEYLLRLPKKVEKNGVLNDIISFNQIFPFQERFYLIASDEPDYTFLYEVNQSKKNQFKLSLYLLDDDTKIGLLRLDYNGQHENP